MDNPTGLGPGDQPQTVGTPQPNPNPPTWQVQVESPQRYPSSPNLPRVDTENTAPTFTTIGQATSHPQVLSTLGGMQVQDGQNLHTLAPPMQPVFAVPGGYEGRLEDYGTGLFTGALQGSLAMTLPTSSTLQHLQQVLQQQQQQLNGDRKTLPPHLQVVPLFDPSTTLQRVSMAPGSLPMTASSLSLNTIGSLGSGLHVPSSFAGCTSSSLALSASALMTSALTERDQLVSSSQSILSGDLQNGGVQNQTIFPMITGGFRTQDDTPETALMSSVTDTDHSVQLALSDHAQHKISETFQTQETETAQDTQSPVYSSVPQESYHPTHLSLPHTLSGIKLDPAMLHSQQGIVSANTLAAINSQQGLGANDRLMAGSHNTSADLSANHMMTSELQLIQPPSQSMMGMNVRHLSDPIGGIIPDTDEEHEQMAHDNELPSTFPEDDPNMIATRKSQRIAERDRTPSPSQKPLFIPKDYYTTDEMWCEECQCSYDPECPRHQPTPVQDKIVLSRAWATLPTMLQIFRLGNTPELGVFARRTIPKRTRFGPFFAPLVENPDQVTNKAFVLKLEQENGSQYFLEPFDENCCNWMMFVRPAGNYEEMNLVAYQYKTDIYFSSVKNIDAKQELKVWYAANYANRLGTHALRPTDEQLNAINGLNKWPCYECSKGFRSSALLQKHLCVHDNQDDGDDDVGDDDGDDDGGIGFDGKPVKRGRKGKGAQGKIPKGKTKKIKELVGEDSTVFQSWKKRKTNMYLNKIKKYREPIKRSLMTLYKKQGKDTGGNEWVCTHCDLTFDNPSLLNLHTLTHAAEDLAMVDLNSTLASNMMGTSAEVGDPSEMIFDVDGDTVVSSDIPPPIIQWDETNLQCPVCDKVFQTKQELILHASEHAKKAGGKRFNSRNPFRCPTCWKGFLTEERLERHMICHSSTANKPFKCQACDKAFMNKSALACHEKTHSNRKYYDCSICGEGFDQIHGIKKHVLEHCVNGMYDCPACHKSFNDYGMIRRHVRSFHAERRYKCPDCGKEFPRADKLKLHSLKHSNERDFMCDICGRQFKRKDKLKEHNKRMHDPLRERKAQTSNPRPRKFVPKVEPIDFNRFIYKCHTCMLGFKRRGMLVNHLAKRHPDMKAEEIPELNLPILRTQRDYFCQYCEKVYKSSSKRKIHIQKYHPGCEVPPSARMKTIQNPSFSQPAGSVTTMPHPCTLCHKQYASKAKLLQHHRSKHQDPSEDKRKYQLQYQTVTDLQMNSVLDKPRVLVIQKQLDNSSPEVIAIAPHAMQGLEALQGTDLLTQAMSELAEFRTQPPGTTIEYQVSGLNQNPLMQQAVQNSTIDLGQLTTSLASSLAQPVGQRPLNTQLLQPVGSMASGQVISPGTITVMSSTQAAQMLSGALPITLASSYIPKSSLNWNTSTTFR